MRTGLIILVVTALLPIGTLSVVQSYKSLEYSRTLIANRLVVNASATAGQEHDTLIIAKHTLLTLSQNINIRAMSALCRDRLKAGMHGNPGLINFVRSDANALVRCSVLPFKEGHSFKNEAWWARGIRNKGFLVSTPTYGSISKQNVLIGTLPLYDASGNNDGALTVVIKLDWLQASLDKSIKNDAAVIAITDAAGQILLKSGRQKLPKFNAQVAAGKAHEVVATDGTQWMYAAAPFFEKSLFVIYAEPKKQMMATALMQARIGLILPMIAILIASLALWLGTNMLVVRWLDSLRDVAAQFARGDYTGDPKRFEKAPREIKMLSDDFHIMAEAIKLRDADLQAALTVKTVVTLDIHHRVKNNLQIVSSLLNLQARQIEDPSAKAALDQTRTRIGALAQIHRLLYEDSNDSGHGDVDIAKLLDQLIIQLRILHRHQPNISLVTKVEQHFVPVDSAVPLSLFTVEAITNVYRHAFPPDIYGTAEISYTVRDNEARLSISDDGIGYKADDNSKSMGKQLMAAFAHQLGGTIEVDKGTDKGTVVTLHYPFS